MSAERDEVLAAGGLVVRHRKGGPQIVLVHRPRYDDWSLPKGKLDPGEGFAEAARREVREETGLRCEIVKELRFQRYPVADGNSKLVRYFLMERRGGSVSRRKPDAEVDRVRWVAAAEALELLSYARDRELVEEALAELPEREGGVDSTDGR